MADLAIAIKIATEDASSGPIDKIKGALGGLTGVISAPTKALGGLVSGLGSLGLAAQGISAVVDGAKGIGNAFGLGALNELEQTRASFNAFTKDAAETERIMGMVRKEAALTPFAFGEMAKSTASLMPVAKSSGVALEDLLKNAEILAASNPLQGLEGASFSLREAMTGDFTSIIERFNLSRSTINKLKEEGVPNIEIIRRAMAEMGFDSDLIAAKAETMEGRWSTFQDTLVTLQTTMGQPIFDALKEGLMSLQGVLDGNMDTFQGWAEMVAGAFTRIIDAGKIFGQLMMGNEVIPEGSAILGDFLPPELIDPILDTIAGIGDIFRSVFAGDIPAVVDDVLGVLMNLEAIFFESVENIAATLAGWVDGADRELMGELGDVLLNIQVWLFETGLVWVEQLGIWAAAFVDWIGPKIPDMLRALGSFAASMLGWIVGDALPALIGKLVEWGTAFVAWIGPKIPPMLAELAVLLGELVGWVVGTALPAIVSKLLEWGAAFVSWVAPLIPPLLVEMGLLWLRLSAWMLTVALPAIVTTLLDWAAAFVAWVGPAIMPLLGELGRLLLELNAWLILVALPAIILKLAEWGAAFVGWIAADVLPALPAALGTIYTAVTGWVGQKVEGVKTTLGELGAAMVTGIQDGIAGALNGLWAWLDREFISKIPAFVRKLLDINSPSGVFEDIGSNLVAGLRVGLEKNLPSVSGLIRSTIGELGGEVGDSGGEVRSYIAGAAMERGIDPSVALRIAKHEGGEDDYMRVGKFPTGWSFWPFQLHYGGAGYEYFGTEAGMGNGFTKKTGLQPGDWRAWDESIDYALDHAKRHGWGAWYGRGPAGVSEWEGITGYQDGGWITEPIAGIGLRSGRGYAFGEGGQRERVTPEGQLTGRARGAGDTINVYGVMPESVMYEVSRRQKTRDLLALVREGA